MEMKKIYRCRTHHVLSGVCAGIGESFGVDPVLIRLGYLFLTLITGIGPGILVYIVAAIVIPVKPHA